MQHCNTLQHTATQCNSLQHTASHCNTLQHTHINTHTHIQEEGHIDLKYPPSAYPQGRFRFHTHTHTLRHTATHTHIRTHTHIGRESHRDFMHSRTLQHIATHNNTLQHTATHYNTPTTHQQKNLLVCCTPRPCSSIGRLCLCTCPTRPKMRRRCRRKSQE